MKAETVKEVILRAMQRKRSPFVPISAILAPAAVAENVTAD